MDMSKIQRALGFIEGVCIGLKDKDAELIEGAIVEIECALEENMSRGWNANIPEVTVRQILVKKEDYLSNSQMEELEERLRKHFTDYMNGKTQNFKQVCCDCIQAVVAITQLQEQLKGKEYCTYLERP